MWYNASLNIKRTLNGFFMSFKKHLVTEKLNKLGHINNHKFKQEKKIKIKYYLRAREILETC